jgi:hypothetical protein
MGAITQKESPGPITITTRKQATERFLIAVEIAGIRIEASSAIKLSKLSGAYSDVDGKGRRFRVRGRMKWEHLVELIFQGRHSD